MKDNTFVLQLHTTYRAMISSVRLKLNIIKMKLKDKIHQEIIKAVTGKQDDENMLNNIMTLIKKHKKAINYSQCCVNKDLYKHPIKGVNEFMQTKTELEDLQFYCFDSEDDLDKCKEQCMSCKSIEDAREEQ